MLVKHQHEASVGADVTLFEEAPQPSCWEFRKTDRPPDRLSCPGAKLIYRPGSGDGQGRGKRTAPGFSFTHFLD